MNQIGVSNEVMRGTMLSRVAENLYWMSRYLERAEHAARMLAVHLNLVLDQSEETAALRRLRFAKTLYATTTFEDGGSEEELCQSITFDLENPNSIVNCVHNARECARQVREQINLEMFQELNQLYLYVRNDGLLGHTEEDLVDFYEEVIERSQLFQGVTDATMNHNQGWLFIQIGRYLERSTNTARLLDIEFSALYKNRRRTAPLHQPIYLEWIGLLKSCSALEAYSKVYTFDLQPLHIAEFLLLDDEFPRSVNFSIASVQSALHAVAEATDTSKNTRVYRLAGRLRALLEYADINEILANGISPFLVDLQEHCAAIHDAIYQLYITYPIEDKLVL